MKQEIMDVITQEIFKQSIVVRTVREIDWDTEEEKLRHLDRELEYLLKMITFKQELLTFLKDKINL